jgi:hypothetical protein
MTQQQIDAYRLIANEAKQKYIALGELDVGGVMHSLIDEIEKQQHGLDFVTVDEMVNELDKRNKGVVLLLIRDRDNESEMSEGWWRGGALQAIGLIEEQKAKILLSRKDQQ